MYKRYLVVITVFITLIACFFLFFDKDSNKDLYTKYANKLEKVKEYESLLDNSELKVEVASDYINNQYHYVITFTSTTTLNNFKAMVINDNYNKGVYYPSFGIFDNKNINLVDSSAKSGETKGVNLVVSNSEKIEKFRIYVSYNNYEHFYLLDVSEVNAKVFA